MYGQFDFSSTRNCSNGLTKLPMFEEEITKPLSFGCTTLISEFCSSWIYNRGIARFFQVNLNHY